MVMDDNEYEAFAQGLEAEFIPVDPALIRAILIDYDLNDKDEVTSLRAQLEVLQASAIAEADSEFDPSGTSGLTASPSPNSHGAQVSAIGQTGGTRSSSDDTSVTGLSADLSGLELEISPTPDGATSAGAENLSLAQKEQQLLEIFPTQTSATIAYVLAKCKENLDQAIDVFLNHIYFENTQSLAAADRIAHKGVDGFDAASTLRSKKAKKRRKGKGEHVVYDVSSSSLDAPPTESRPISNHWQASVDKVSFITNRICLDPKTVQPLLNKHGGSVKTIIRTLVEEDVLKHQRGSVDGNDNNLEVALLASKFPSLSADDAAALIRLSKPSAAHAHELAEALTGFEKVRPADTNGPIIPRYTPIKLDEDDVEPRPTSSGSASGATISAAQLAQLRSNAFDSASSSHRKAGSNRLFGGAAAYYSQVGRDYSTQLRVASSAEADALVARQSSADMLDLHGIGVQDALRITADKVGLWWQAVRVREARSMSERVGQGFTVVTGRGSHSKDGKGKLGPAVVRMLVANGWKVEVSSGLVTVKGKAR